MGLVFFLYIKKNEYGFVRFANFVCGLGVENFSGRLHLFLLGVIDLKFLFYFLTSYVVC